MKRNISLSIDRALLERADRLARPGENRTALFERLLSRSVREEEEAALDALYDRVLADHPVTDTEQERRARIARAAYRSVHGPGR
jgi:hypothetical protein